jgi:hypothetical protein
MTVTNTGTATASIPQGEGQQYNTNELEVILIDAGWSPSEINDALGVIGAESSGSNDPPNYAGATGIFQVLQSHWNGLAWTAPKGTPHNEAEYTTLLETNPEFNAQQALQLFNAEGWQPWETDSYIANNPQLLKNPAAQGSTAATLTSTGVGSVVGPGGTGFLKGLQNLLNPSLSPSIGLNPISDIENVVDTPAKAAMMIFFRGAFVVLGLSVMVGGLAILVLGSNDAVPTPIRAIRQVQQIREAPARLQLEQQRTANTTAAIAQRSQPAAAKTPTHIYHHKAP